MSNRIYHKPVKPVHMNWLLSGLLARHFAAAPKLPTLDKGLPLTRFFKRVIKWVRGVA